MENTNTTINTEPLRKFFTEIISPCEFEALLDQLIFDYFKTLIHYIQVDHDGIHEQTYQFIYYLKALRDILPECQQTES